MEPSQPAACAMRLKLPSFKFNIRQLLLLMLLIGVLAAILSSAINQQPMQNYAAICFSQDGKMLAMMGNENTRIYDLESGRLKRSIMAVGDGIAGRAILEFKDSDTLVFFSEGRRSRGLAPGVYFYSISANKLYEKISTTIFSQDVAISPAGVAIRDETTFKVDCYKFDADDEIDADISITKSTIAVRKSDDRVWLSDDGRYITLFSGFFHSRLPGDPLRTHSSDFIAIGGETSVFDGEAHASAVLSPDNRLVVLSSNYNRIQCLEFDSRKEIWRYENANASEEVEFSSDGTTIVFQGVSEPNDPYGSDRFIAAVAADSGQEKFRIDTQDNMPSPYAVSPDGNLVAVATERYTDHGVEVWDVENKTLVGLFGGGNRSLKLWLYLLLVALWPFAWLIFGTSRTAGNVTKPSWQVTIGLAFLWLIGVLVVIYAISFDLILLSRFGTFGTVPFPQQVLVVILSTFGLLTGMVMMVLGLSGMGRHFQKSNELEQND